MTRFKQHKELPIKYIQNKLKEFFNEDDIDNDLTTQLVFSREKEAEAVFIAKENLVFAGKAIIEEAFFNCKIISIKNDGDMIAEGQSIAKIKGDIRSILKKERVVLNLIQRLSAIATKVSKLVQITKEKGIELLDTRKTTPGLRLFEKFAVVVGGGTNHRFSLSSSVMLKDNHLSHTSSILKSVKQVKNLAKGKDIQVEADTVDLINQILQSEASSILLDNFKPKKLSEVVDKIRTHPKGKNIYIELSGGITEQTLESFCVLGVDGISMGALTHNVKNVDISLDIK
ncbi:MAG: nicotinate-nucleotide diphosphorylase (carboxylating) [Candidatus Marinimicrobia bacterium]|nr:nicotinate-nucleotide diphosphorylase (carboxylating) [Candidatus Neomarinimicrobiota bacterium]